MEFRMTVVLLFVESKELFCCQGPRTRQAGIPQNVFNRLRWWLDKKCFVCLHHLISSLWSSSQKEVSLLLLFFFASYMLFTSSNRLLFLSLKCWVILYKLFTVQGRKMFFHISCLSQQGRRAGNTHSHLKSIEVLFALFSHSSPVPMTKWLVSEVSLTSSVCFLRWKVSESLGYLQIVKKRSQSICERLYHTMGSMIQPCDQSVLSTSGSPKCEWFSLCYPPLKGDVTPQEQRNLYSTRTKSRFPLKSLKATD